MTAATVESAWSIFGGDLLKLSEQQLVDCTSTDQGSYGCNGAYTNAAFDYYIEAQTAIRLSDYPYTAV